MKIILLIVNILFALTAIAYPIIWLFFQADQLLHTLPYVMSLLWLIKSLIHPNKGAKNFCIKHGYPIIPCGVATLTRYDVLVPLF